MTHPRPVPAVRLPASQFPGRPVADLLAMARDGLAAAGAVVGVDGASGAQRYVCAHLAALRAAAAVLAARARPTSGATRRGRPASVWALLVQVAPELGEWAAFFSATARTRAAVEGGRLRVVSAREADDLVRDAGRFIEVVEHLLGRLTACPRGTAQPEWAPDRSGPPWPGPVRPGGASGPAGRVSPGG